MAAVFMLATNLALGAALMYQSRNAMKTQIDERMLDVVNTAAAMLDGDVLEKLTAEDKGTPEYQSVLDTLVRFRDNIDLAYTPLSLIQRFCGHPFHSDCVTPPLTCRQQACGSFPCQNEKSAPQLSLV